MNYIELLKTKNIQPSNYRIKVLECLSSHEEHLSVDMLYQALAQVFPTVSKMSIYNTIEVLLKAGLIRRINIDNEVRYDSMLENHGHITCECCGKIYNFDVNMDHLPVNGLENFIVKFRDVYFKGICPDCNH